MATLSGLQNLYISDDLLDTTPELRPRNVKTSPNTTVKIAIETIVITAVIFIAIITWFEVLRSLFDNIFSESPNYRSTWLRILYAMVVTIIGIILIELYGKETFKGDDKT